MTHRTRARTAAALATLIVSGALVLTGCGASDGAPDHTTRTTQSEDPPESGPQSGPNPAGGEPVPGTSPANG